MGDIKIKKIDCGEVPIASSYQLFFYRLILGLRDIIKTTKHISFKRCWLK